MKAGLHWLWRLGRELRLSHVLVIGFLSLSLISCTNPARQRHGIDNYAGWPLARQAQGRAGGERRPVKRIVHERRPVTKKTDVPRDRALRRVEHAPLKGPFPPVRATLPVIPGAEMVREDELCALCHETHATLFPQKNAHRNLNCEDCHGPASQHLITRGQDESKFLDIGKLDPAARSELCLRCHEKEAVVPPHVAQWRASIHANKNVSCSDCHVAHHDVPKGTPTITPPQAAINPPDVPYPNRRRAAREGDATVLKAAANAASPDPKAVVAARAQEPPPRPRLPSLRGASRGLLADSAATCYRCHDGSHRLTELVGPHKLGSEPGFKCTTCHDAHGDVTEAALTDACVKCHSGPLSSTWHSATHNEAGMRCADCHAQHPAVDARTAENIKRGQLQGVPLPMAVSQTTACTRCHEETKPLVAVAGPHQVGGSSKLQCTTCHDAHGRVQDVNRKDLCLSCHNSELSTRWHSATHNEAGLLCTDCHNPHPSGGPQGLAQIRAGNFAAVPRSMAVSQATTCVSCHQETKLNVALPHSHQVGGPNRFECTTCHDPHGQVSDATGKDLCLRCHDQGLSATWHGSTHDQAGLRCSDCHDPHPSLGPAQLASLAQGTVAGLPRPLLASTVDGCVKCHEKTRQLLEIADPHQVGGPNRFECTTCHDPHGKVREETRKDLCLTCHTGTPTAAWHSSIHNLQGIACTDCHDPHPEVSVQKTLDIRHTNIRRPKRLPMSVNEPDTCYKCHPQIYGRSLMPSHHPIFEGKMVCSTCHDSHGQALRLLNEPQLNLVCYKCHSEVQGPFVYEHPPVTEDCSICHEPHGTVENNLLRQPVTFLCMRCHSGHRTGPPFHDQTLLPDIGKSQPLQKAFFSDCVQCHSQIHGSDVPSPNRAHTLAR